MNNIDILMATYNGAKFIASQIRSLQNQTFTDWKLLIHDDGSTDGTIEILNFFCANDKRINIINDGIQFHNCALNFMHLLKYSDATFCIFCDQDDIWLENKLQVMHDFISKKDNSKPQAVYSNSYVYDTETSKISGSASLCIPNNLKDILFMNAGIQGCALMFNSLLRDICCKIPNIIAMHDHVLTLGAATFGELSYISYHLMLYRRHTATVTGATARSIKERIIPFFDSKKRVLDKKHYNAIQSFVETYQNEISDSKMALFNDFFSFEKENRLMRIFHIFIKHYKLYGHSSILAFKVLTRKFI